MLVDVRMRLPHRVMPDNRLVFVDIDDKSIELLGRWPWPRSRLAEVIRILDGAGPWGIFVDVLFAEETSPENDLALVRVFEEAERIFLGVAVEFKDHDAAGTTAGSNLSLLKSLSYETAAKGNSRFPKAGRAVIPLSAFVVPAKGIGHISFVPDADGVARHLPLFVDVDGRFFPSIDIELARSLLDVEKEDIEVFPGDSVFLRNARLPGKEEAEDLQIPIDSRGRILINYAGCWGRMFPHYSLQGILTDLLDEDENVNRQAENLLSEKLIILSVSFSGASDMGPTPLEPLVRLSEIHGHVISSILHRQFLRKIPTPATLAVAFLVCAGIGACCFRFRVFAFAIAGAAAILLWLLLSFAFFSMVGWITDIVWPCSVIVLAFGGCTGYTHLKAEQERSSLRRAFSRYVSPELLAQIVENPDKLKLGGERVNLTVLVLVLEKFERVTENAEAEEIIEFLSATYEKACEIIFANDGAIDTFTKDGLIAFFGAPLEREDHAIAAVRAAVSIKQALLELGAKRFARYPVGAKMALNRGFATVGNIGSSRRMNYTVIGKNVDLGIHLAHAAREGQILIPRKTFEGMESFFDVEEVGEMRVGPYPKPVHIFNVRGMIGESFLIRSEAVYPAATIGTKKFLGPYILMEKIGAGNMGTVYRGYDEVLERQVAIKVFPHLEKDAIAAVAREAKALAKLSHPNVVQVYSAGEEDDVAYLVMEFVDGQTVRELLNTEGPLPVAEALDILIQACRGLNAAQKEDIIHRDIKPANLLINNHGMVKIADFGLARLANRGESTHTVAGTFQYMSPEQARGAALDCRADIYSLGITFFHLLAGEPPFKADTIAGLAWHHSNTEMPDEPLRKKEVPEAVITLIRRMTAKQTEERHRDYLELLKELDRVEASLPAG